MTHAPSDMDAAAATPTNGRDTSFWRSHTTIALQPVAAPSILGLFGFAAATFMVASNLAGWYGTTASRAITMFALVPFAVFAGGVAQFLAGMWSYKARDGLATAMHGIWGAFWLGDGLYLLLVAGGVLLPPTARTFEIGLGYWFIVLAAITVVGAIAALAKNWALFLVLFVLAGGSILLAIAWVTPVSWLVAPAGDVLVASAVIAWYTASALMLEGVFQRPVLPVGHIQMKPRARTAQLQPIQYELGEPGVRAGQ
ncbi:MAG: GPR1/FUN34/YaaH family transporter [Nocardiopsaceae bacterium]|nr:GPR1/FUN34/YaaH family transporter [Nocardiopsaceae bacterium]